MFLHIKSYHLLTTWSCKLKQQTKNIILARVPMAKKIWQNDDFFWWSSTYNVTWTFDHVVLWDARFTYRRKFSFLLTKILSKSCVEHFCEDSNISNFVKRVISLDDCLRKLTFKMFSLFQNSCSSEETFSLKFEIAYNYFYLQPIAISLFIKLCNNFMWLILTWIIGCC